GEVFRSMLPPVTELSSQREVVLTASGRAMAEELAKKFLLSEDCGGESRALIELSKKAGCVSLAGALKLGFSREVLERFERRGLVQIRENVKGRKRKTQRIIAWRGEGTGEPADAEKIERLHALLEIERGPLPLAQLLKLAQASRSLIDRLIGTAVLASWEEPLDPAEDPFDSGYEPPR